MDPFFWYWLTNLSGIGNVKLRKLLDTFETPEQIYKAQKEDIQTIDKITKRDVETILEGSRNSQLYKEYLAMKKAKIGMVPITDEGYPMLLKTIYDAPICLYYKGQLPQPKETAVAIVGSRSCSEYGRKTAVEIGKILGKAGVLVVSGMAVGIDLAAHEGALIAGGNTVAVLGCGVDICYPAMAKPIYEQICKKGCVISEYPPGMKPTPGQFPMRNRIISGMSNLVVVVEARKKSGSLITVDQALEQNREVLAVPGRIGDALSEGCNNLIQMGAGIVTQPEDILNTLEMLNPDFAKNVKKKNFILAPEEEMVYSELDLIPKSLEELLENYEGNSAKYTEILMRLVLKGAAKETSLGYYVKL